MKCRERLIEQGKAVIDALNWGDLVKVQTLADIVTADEIDRFANSFCPEVLDGVVFNDTVIVYHRVGTGDWYVYSLTLKSEKGCYRFDHIAVEPNYYRALWAVTCYLAVGFTKNALIKDMVNEI